MTDRKRVQEVHWSSIKCKHEAVPQGEKNNLFFKANLKDEQTEAVRSSETCRHVTSAGRGYGKTHFRNIRSRSNSNR